MGHGSDMIGALFRHENIRVERCQYNSFIINKFSKHDSGKKTIFKTQLISPPQGSDGIDSHSNGVVVNSNNKIVANGNGDCTSNYSDNNDNDNFHGGCYDSNNNLGKWS